MSNVQENQPTEITDSPLPTQTGTVVSNHEGEDGMDSRRMTMGRYEEIRWRLERASRDPDAATQNVQCRAGPPGRTIALTPLHDSVQL